MKSRLFLLLTILLFTACAPAISTPTAVVPANAAVPSPMPTASPSGPAPWSLVADGDSIPFNSSQDCPLCTGFVDRYAEAITAATGHPVKVQNLSQHTGLQTDDLLQTVENNPNWQKALANADIIIVSIGHNDTPWGREDDPCESGSRQYSGRLMRTTIGSVSAALPPKPRMQAASYSTHGAQ